MPFDPAHPWSPAAIAARHPALVARSRIIAAMRQAFAAEGFLEVEPSPLQVSGGLDVHVRPLAVAVTDPLGGPALQAELHTSPEFAMKALLAGGLERIVSLGPVFRDGDLSPLHTPAFTMAEWYAAGWGSADAVAHLERLLQAVAAVAPGPWRHGALSCDFTQPLELLSVVDAVRRYAGLDLDPLLPVPDADQPDPAPLRGALRGLGLHAPQGDTWEDLFLRLLMERVEPHLGVGRATVLHGYPACLGALARLDPADPRVALRFELYLCGVEIANGYDELTDAAAYRHRFRHDAARRGALYGRPGTIDSAFLAVLEEPGLPASAGVALGVDRLVMVALGAATVQEVQAAPFIPSRRVP